MDVSRISARYAKALYEYAADREKEKEIYDEMKFISEVFFSVPHLTSSLDNPRIPSEKKKELLIMAAGTDVVFEFKRFVDLVIKHKREAYFHFISLKYQDIYRKKHGMVIGKLTTAQPVDKPEEERMKKVVADITQCDVDFETKINPDIIGGFILQIGTYQIDASISNQLKRVKETLLHECKKVDPKMLQ
jgi:F-type H+-transporting ATPase subunit delta